MEIPTNLIPNKNLDLKIEELKKERSAKIPNLKDLIYEGIELVDFRGSKDHRHSYADFEFNENTKILLTYTSKGHSGKKLMRIEGSDLGLYNIKITTTVKNPINSIEKIFSKKSFMNKSLIPQLTDFRIEEMRIPKIKKKKLKKSKCIPLKDTLIMDRIAFEYSNKEDYYKVSEGRFVYIIWINELERESVLGDLNIYQILPFTEKEKEILSNLKVFRIDYHFPRPKEYVKEEKRHRHIFKSLIRKEGDMYKLSMSIDEGYLSGLDLESLWPAKNLIDYINSKKKMILLKKKAYKISTSNIQSHIF